MLLFAHLAAAAGCLAAVASAATNTTTAANASTTSDHVQFKIRDGELGSRAVNLGGWLLSEHWMCFTSPLYKGVPDDVGPTGEYGVMKFLGKEQGDKQFEDHWSSFITEEDVAQVAKYGFNTVRVTTGFWIINDEDKTDQSELTLTYPSGGLKHLDKVVNEWGVKYNLAVMVSLHAHRGSQNGYDHSAPPEMGKQTWDKDPANVASSLNYAKFIANRYKDSPAFLGLNLMNEPNYGIDYEILKKYFLDAYKAIREDGNDCIIVTSPWLQNQGPPTMSDFMTCPDYYNVWHEWHIYYRWGWEQYNKPTMLKAAATYAQNHFDKWSGNPIFMGEWSLTTTDEVNMTVPQLRNFSKLQLAEYEQAPAGHAFWAWRHDEETKKNPSGWSLRQLLKEKIVEMPTTPLTRNRGPKCAGWVKPTISSSSGNGDDWIEIVASDSGSGGTVELFKPGSVEPEDSTSSVAPEATTSAARIIQSTTAAFITLASAALAWTTL